ncbi:MAG: hypothetical protein ABIR96_12920 [Bdellovibrionota bacterium]
MTQNTHLHLTQDLRKFFAEECLSIASKQGLQIPEHLSHYLGEMLVRFVGSDTYFVANSDPLAMKPKKEFPSVVRLWLEGQAQPIFEQLVQMQHVGDIALYTSGFFPERIERSLVDMDFYMAVGGQAYERAGKIRESIAQERELNIYFELASKFSELKELLAELSDRKFLSTEADRLRLYQKWLQSRSPRIRRMLAEVGILAQGGSPHDGSDGT